MIVSKKSTGKTVFEKIKPEAENLILDQFKTEQSNTCTGSNKKDIDVFTLDSIAEFPGGTDAMLRYLSENIIYPQAAIERGITGKVYLQFIVEADGTITCIKVMKGTDYLLDREAFRCVRNFPKFRPAFQGGIAVPCLISLPIAFNLN